MRKLLYIVLFLSVGKHLQATNYNCHTEAGQLQSLIEEQHRTITNLTVSGTIDVRDFAFINDSLFHLTGINLADCTIDAFESRDIYLGNQTRFDANCIPANTFFGFQELTTVRLPQNTKKIGKGAFAGCTKLKNIDWGNNLQEIAGFAFCDCFSLNTSLPQTLEKIGEYAFKQCTSFTGIDLSLSVLRSIGNQAFLNCTALSSITLPASLQSIGKECFAGCSSLTGITLPQKPESMGEGCFSHCISLTEVDIKECPLENLPPYTFDHCTKLLSIQAPNTITEIGEGAFYYCTSLTDCILPESVRTIGDYAFAGCSRIAGLSFLPEGTEKIGRWPFYGMKYLFSAKIPSTVKTIGDHAFDNCTRLNVMLSYPTEPPILGENVFRSVPQKDCRLGIPDESLSLYLNTPQWKEFDIRYLSEVDEQQIDDKALKAYFEQKMLIVNSYEPMHRITLYTIDGRTIYQKQGKTTEAKIDTQSYSGEIFILSVQIESGKYYHLKLGRVN